MKTILKAMLLLALINNFFIFNKLSCSVFTLFMFMFQHWLDITKSIKKQVKSKYLSDKFSTFSLSHFDFYIIRLLSFTITLLSSHFDLSFSWSTILPSHESKVLLLRTEQPARGAHQVS